MPAFLISAMLPVFSNYHGLLLIVAWLNAAVIGDVNAMLGLIKFESLVVDHFTTMPTLTTADDATSLVRSPMPRRRAVDFVSHMITIR